VQEEPEQTTTPGVPTGELGLVVLVAQGGAKEAKAGRGTTAVRSRRRVGATFFRAAKVLTAAEEAEAAPARC